jgi:hypothetical protein
MTNDTTTMTEMPRWLFETYPGSELEAADFLEGRFYEAHKASYLKTAQELIAAGKATQDQVKFTHEVASTLHQRALNEAAPQAWNLQDTLVRASTVLLYRVSQSESWRYDADAISSEIESLAAWVHNKISAVRDKSTRSDLIYIIETLFPVWEKLDPSMRPSAILADGIRFSKLRTAVPILRNTSDALLALQKTVEEKGDSLKRVISKEEARIETFGGKMDVEELAKAKAKIADKKEELAILEETAPLAMAHENKQFSEMVGRAIEAMSDKNMPPEGPKGIQNYVSTGEKGRLFEGLTCLVTEEGGVIKRMYVFEIEERFSKTAEAKLKHLVKFTDTDPNVIQGHVKRYSRDEGV